MLWSVLASVLWLSGPRATSQVCDGHGLQEGAGDSLQGSPGEVYKTIAQGPENMSPRSNLFEFPLR